MASVATWRQRYQAAASRLDAAHEARWLVEEMAGGFGPDELDGRVGERAGARFDAMVERRAAGEPLQYVLGHWAFRSLDLLVDRRVLIPRPETEVVVDVALASLGDRLGGVAVDLGTGSGAIGLSLAAEVPQLEVWLTDVSADALAVAQANLTGVGTRIAPRVRVARGDWWEALPAELRGHVDLAVANPPYVSTAELASLDPTVADWEPVGALVAGPDGSEEVRRILSGARPWLAAGGAVVLEIAPQQASAAAEAARSAGFASTWVHADLAGRDRVLVART